MDSTKHPLPFALLVASLVEEPTCFMQVAKSRERRAGMDLEFTTVQGTSTWTLVPHEPHINVVGCKLVYGIQRNPINRYKARLIAK